MLSLSRWHMNDLEQKKAKERENTKRHYSRKNGRRNELPLGCCKNYDGRQIRSVGNENIAIFHIRKCRPLLLLVPSVRINDTLNIFSSKLPLHLTCRLPLLARFLIPSASVPANTHECHERQRAPGARRSICWQANNNAFLTAGCVPSVWICP